MACSVVMADTVVQDGIWLVKSWSCVVFSWLMADSSTRTFPCQSPCSREHRSVYLHAEALLAAHAMPACCFSLGQQEELQISRDSCMQEAHSSGCQDQDKREAADYAKRHACKGNGDGTSASSQNGQESLPSLPEKRVTRSLVCTGRR